MAPGVSASNTTWKQQKVVNGKGGWRGDGVLHCISRLLNATLWHSQLSSRANPTLRRFCIQE
jgi:hypothetical protein